MNTIDKLTEIFKKFPGIGPRQAKRFVYFLLTRNDNTLRELSEAILRLKGSVKMCQSCFRFYAVNGDKNLNNLCNICISSDRDSSLLMIIERDADLENIERNNVYKGLYFVLGGSIPVLDRDPYNKIRIRELLDIISERGSGGFIKEVILATGANPDGDNTAVFIKKELDSLKDKYAFKISVLGRGLSTGTELEYSDSDTLRSALENRH